MPYLKQYVEIFEAKPNPMFSEDQRELVRFLRYNEAVKCAECGKKSKHMWTSICSFEALTMAVLIPAKSGKIHPPLTPVCRSHLMAAELTELAELTKEKPKRKRK